MTYTGHVAPSALVLMASYRLILVLLVSFIQR